MLAEHPTARLLPLEIQFLCATLEPCPGPRHQERLLALGREIRDWPELFTRAQEHRVLSPLVQIMKTVEIPDLPTLWQEYVETELANRTYESLVLTQELARLAKCFEERGAAVVPYKGPLLAILCGKSVSSRQYENLDTLVRESDWDATVGILREGGYRALYEFDSADHDEKKRTEEDSYRRGDISVTVRLQAVEMLPHVPRRLEWEDLTKRLVQVSVGGTPVRTISREDCVSLIAAQATRHCWSRLQWTLDVARLVASPEFDWAMALERARQMGVERMVLLGLGLVESLLQTVLPEEVAGRIARDPGLRKLQEFVLDVIAQGGHAEAGAGWARRAAFRVRSFDSVSDGLRHAVRRAAGADGSRRVRERIPATTPWRWLALIKAVVRGRRLRPRKDLGGFLPTPEPVVEKLLELAAPRPGDVLYDLGCGDGRVVVAAAKRYGIRCVGVDLDSQLLAGAKERARREGVEHLVRLIRQDAKTVDVSEATILHLFVATLGNALLRPYLEEHLKPGTRIVSANAQMLGWPPERRVVVADPGGAEWTLFLMRAGAPQASEPPRTASPACARS